jgi:hypothetical protein
LAEANAVYVLKNPKALAADKGNCFFNIFAQTANRTAQELVVSPSVTQKSLWLLRINIYPIRHSSSSLEEAKCHRQLGALIFVDQLTAL